METQPTVRTFLIADVRGYTRFTREHGDAAAARLAKKFADLARDAVEARRGRVLELRGDEALAVFENAAQAVRAAVELQAACGEESAEDPTIPLPVGIGIDAGEAIPVEDGFRGVALNMAARLCSNAAAGQVLVTRTIVSLAETVGGIAFQEKGPASFKGFEQPVDVIEAVATDRPLAPSTAPAPPSAALPPELDALTPLVGREYDMHWLRGTWRQARRGQGRVVFLSGPHGIGKTRLAAELAGEVDRAACETRYAGAGGTAAALARSAVEAAVNATRPTLVVLDDLEVTADGVAALLADSFDRIETRPVLVIGIATTPEGAPALAALIERADVLGDGHQRLTPLDASGVRDIAGAYVGSDVLDVPIESMHRASGGVPGRIHEVVSDWARDEASRRLAAAAEWMAQGRTQRRADLEFANNVIGLKLGRLYGAGEGVQTDTKVCPFKGLASFEEDDAASFFGRERLIGELAARTVHAGLLGVLGASGSGKSSAISAGLIPSLRAGLLPGSERWTPVTMRPGERPTAALAGALPGSSESPTDALATIPEDGRLVLVVDQFEEVFTVCNDEDERAAFIATLTDAAAGSPDSVIVVIALRGDFYGHCAAYPALADALAANHVLVGSMSPEELRRAIELPARRAGLRVESALTEALIGEVTDEPGGLPLLSTTLVELWQQRSDGWLRMEMYERTGGVRGAVGRLADSAYDHLSEIQRDSARNIFLRLTGPGEGDAVTRRRVPLAEFDLDRDEVATVVLRRLTEDRLLTMDESSVEVAHEALLREWPLLRGWLEEDAQGRLLRQHLTQAANQWEASGREPSELYRGARLSAALDWSTEHGAELNDLERAFLADSRSASEREAEKQRRTNRRLRGLLVGAAVFLVVAVVAGIIALVQRGNAQKSATVALSKSLGAQAVSQPQLDLAMLLARQGVDLDVSQQTRSTLLSTLNRSPAAIGAYYGDGGRPLEIGVSPDGRMLAIQQNTGRVVFRDIATGKLAAPTRTVAGGGVFASFEFTPDGNFVLPRFDATGGIATQIDLVAPATGRVVRSFALPREVRTEDFIIVAERVSPDGRFLLIGFGNPVVPDRPAYLLQYDLVTGRMARPVIRIDRARLMGAVYTAGGRQIVTSGAMFSVFDARTGRQLRRFGEGREGTAVSPDGRTIVIGGEDGSVAFIDVATGRTTVGTGGHRARVLVVGFSRDGRRLVSAGDDRDVLVWDPRNHVVVERFVGHAGKVTRVAFTADGDTLFSSSLDGTVLAWDLTGSRRFGRSVKEGPGTEPPEGQFSGPAPNLAVSPDSATVAFGNKDGTVRLFDLATLRETKRFTTRSGSIVAAVSFAGDGKAILATSVVLRPDAPPDVSLQLWSIDGTPRAIRSFEDIPLVTWGTFTPDHRTVVASGLSIADDGKETGFIAAWDAQTGRLKAPPTAVGPAAIFVSPNRDGSLVAASLNGRDVVLVDPLKGKLMRRIKEVGLEPVLAIAMSPDGRTVAVGPWDGRLRLFDTTTGRPIGKAVKAADGPVTGIGWSPDGSTIVTGGSDGTTRLFDAATQQWIGTPLPGLAGNQYEFVGFTPDGKNVIAAYDTGDVFVWPARHQDWARHACAVARRDFTRDEWTLYLGDRPYEKTCTG